MLPQNETKLEMCRHVTIWSVHRLNSQFSTVIGCRPEHQVSVRGGGGAGLCPPIMSTPAPCSLGSSDSIYRNKAVEE